LRFGGVKLIAGEATLCIDMAGAPVGRWRGGSDAHSHRHSPSQ